MDERELSAYYRAYKISAITVMIVCMIMVGIALILLHNWTMVLLMWILCSAMMLSHDISLLLLLKERKHLRRLIRDFVYCGIWIGISLVWVLK